jgi:PHD/YefM family antitoxin component YafN of YafNO toxin-antitoxin module
MTKNKNLNLAQTAEEGSRVATEAQKQKQQKISFLKKIRGTISEQAKLTFSMPKSVEEVPFVIMPRIVGAAAIGAALYLAYAGINPEFAEKMNMSQEEIKVAQDPAVITLLGSMGLYLMALSNYGKKRIDLERQRIREMIDSFSRRTAKKEAKKPNIQA